MLFLFLASGVSVVLVALLALHAWAARRPKVDLPGPETKPVFSKGFYKTPRSSHFKLLCLLRQKYGNIYRLYLGNKLYVVIAEPRDLERVLGSSRIINRDDYLASIFRRFTGDGLFATTGEKWRKHRKIINPTFHLQVLAQFVEIFSEGSMALAQKLSQLCYRPVDILPELSIYTLDMICKTAMGTTGEDRAAMDEFSRAVVRAVDLGQTLFGKPWLAVDWIYSLTSGGREHKKILKVLQDYMDGVIDHKLKEAAERLAGDCTEAPKRQAFLDMVIQSGTNVPLSKEEIRDEVHNLITTGYKTIATTLGFALCVLGIYPEWQDQVLRELDDVFGEDSLRPVTFGDLSQLQLLERVLKETLRLFPSVPVITRELPVSIRLGPEDTEIPAGSNAIIFTYFTHRMAEFFPDPFTFNPDRFLPGNVAGRHPYCFLPFGAGLRNCIGSRYAMMQMKTVLATVLRRFRVFSISTREQLEDLNVSVVMKPNNGFHVQLEPRTAFAG